MNFNDWFNKVEDRLNSLEMLYAGKELAPPQTLDPRGHPQQQGVERTGEPEKQSLTHGHCYPKLKRAIRDLEHENGLLKKQLEENIDKLEQEKKDLQQRVADLRLLCGRRFEMIKSLVAALECEGNPINPEILRELGR